jgi:hypothetical protein
MQADSENATPIAPAHVMRRFVLNKMICWFFFWMGLQEESRRRKRRSENRSGGADFIPRVNGASCFYGWWRVIFRAGGMLYF